jgi:hypothetical protein
MSVNSFPTVSFKLRFLPAIPGTNAVNKVDKRGDVMLGYLTLNADPITALGAATKQYVDLKGIGNVVASGTPSAGQIARWTDATHIEGIATGSLGFAPLNSPVFTGDPQAPTPAVSDNDTSIATTAYVKANLANFQPLDADLTSLAGASATNAIFYRSVADTWAPVTIGANLTFSGGTLAATGGGGGGGITSINSMTGPAISIVGGTGITVNNGSNITTVLGALFSSSAQGDVPASGGGTANFLRADGTWVAPVGGGSVPTYQTFTSGSGTYTTPANCKQIEVTLVGGGGGGCGGGSTPSDNATAAGNTTFGSGPLFQAGGGGNGRAGSASGMGGTGGTVSGSGTPIASFVGGTGDGASVAASSVGGNGGMGGSSTLGGGGGGGAYVSGNNAGRAAAANTGAGGGGGGTTAANLQQGAGGGAGATIQAIINSPAATYSYAVGTGGAGGSAGTSGGAGGNGGSGIIIVKEIY